MTSQIDYNTNQANAKKAYRDSLLEEFKIAKNTRSVKEAF